jgi:hypothetical protein
MEEIDGSALGTANGQGDAATPRRPLAGAIAVPWSA